jgi:hypothetical protein
MPTTQPPPTRSADSKPITCDLIELILQRRKLGISKYGTELHTHNGRNALQDALEESLDLNQYLFQHAAELRDQQPQQEPEAQAPGTPPPGGVVSAQPSPRSHTVRVTQELVFPDSFEGLLKTYERMVTSIIFFVPTPIRLKNIANRISSVSNLDENNESYREAIIDSAAELMALLSPTSDGQDARPTEEQPSPTIPGDRESRMGNSVLTYLPSLGGQTDASKLYRVCALDGVHFDEFWQILESLKQQGFVNFQNVQDTMPNKGDVLVTLAKPKDRGLRSAQTTPADKPERKPSDLGTRPADP